MDPIVVGEVENPQDIDLEPIPIEVVGYTREGHKRVGEVFNFRASLPFANTLALIDQVEQGTGRMAGNTIKWLKNCLVSAEEGERFWAYLLRDDLEIAQQTLESTYEALAEVYAARPTLPSAVSSNGGRPTKQTSPAASRARASKSKRSR